VILHTYYAAVLALLTTVLGLANTLPKCGQPQSFLNIPQEDIVKHKKVRANSLIVFIFFGNHVHNTAKGCHACAHTIGKQIVPLAAAPVKQVLL
jgi:hypothetical protein